MLVVSAQGERDPVVDALGAGASGYLTKSSEPGEIATAVRAIGNGQTYVSPTLASYLLQSAKGTSALDLSKAGDRASEMACQRTHRRRHRRTDVHLGVGRPRSPRSGSGQGRRSAPHPPPRSNRPQARLRVVMPGDRTADVLYNPEPICDRNSGTTRRERGRGSQC